MKKKFLSLIMLFFILLCCSCSQKDDYKLSIIAPSGAPGIALANVSYNYSNEYRIELNKTADVLKSSFASLESDVIIAPINLGAAQYKANQTYVLTSVVTWGNLYFASQKENFKIDDLNGADIVLFGNGTINDAIVTYILENKGITPSSVTYLASTSETNAQLISDSEAIVLVAEPSLSVAKSKKNNISSISIQDLYKEISGTNSYPQAGCFIKNTTIEEHKNLVDKFLNLLEESCKKCDSNVSLIAEYASQLELGGTKQILEIAIPNSNISFVKAISAKNDIEKMVEINPKLFGGAKPVEGFYYA